MLEHLRGKGADLLGRRDTLLFLDALFDTLHSICGLDVEFDFLACDMS